jgi:hypothetical protein
MRRSPSASVESSVRKPVDAIERLRFRAINIVIAEVVFERACARTVGA